MKIITNNGYIIGTLNEETEQTFEEVAEVIGGEVVDIPDNSQIIVGDKAEYYNENWQRKSFRELVNLGYKTFDEYVFISEYNLSAATADYLNRTAQSRGYDDINSACSYSNSTNHIYAAEGMACVQFRDEVYTALFDIYTACRADEREYPTVTELLDELPTINWQQ